MVIKEIRNAVEDKTARLAVIGVGYVGLPVAAMFAEAGFDVKGVEIIPDRVEKINNGISASEFALLGNTVGATHS